MRQAIITKYLGPTDTRGARIKATAEAGSVLFPYDHSLSVEGNHASAARALMAKYGWDKYCELIGGGYANGYVFVQVDKETA